MNVLQTAVQQFGLGIQALRAAPRWFQALLAVVAAAIVVLAIAGVIPGRVIVLIAGVAIGLIYAVGINREIHQRAREERDDPDDER